MESNRACLHYSALEWMKFFGDSRAYIHSTLLKYEQEKRSLELGAY